MAFDPDCIFCKIVQEEIPAAKVYEDEYVLAFLDISQVTKGHTLLIPKDHQPDIFHLDSELAAHLFSVAPRIARAIEAEFKPLGMNLLNNNGEAAEQSVFHYHMHFIPRYGDGQDGYQPNFQSGLEVSNADLQAMATSIQKQLEDEA
ncbi:histidine triad (HIT) family protein [Salsuginibacillus halophilus]|uniref:Histidine triad (HIT) family protein n=1 Tax=Salsuginibacillus halophilus TaxID=517424 RepID=A0A2P8HG38_9BACI|nr:HIT family protein [Salsuginibacillus halophilus]PSL45154.1 histidine triad (HIT) family protein [Salsuginibacillus halophilus]